MMEQALTASLVFAAIAWVAFTASYLLRAKWWKTPFGWNMMGVSAVLALIFGRLALLYVDPDVTADLKFFGLAMYVLAGILGFHRLYLMEKAQRTSGKHSSLI
jgi:hypothetical protein